MLIAFVLLNLASCSSSEHLCGFTEKPLSHNNSETCCGINSSLDKVPPNEASKNNFHFSYFKRLSVSINYSLEVTITKEFLKL